MRYSNRWTGIIATASLLAAAAAASVPVQAKAAGGTVQVGVIGSFTGFESFLGPDLESGVAAAAAEINAAGGIDGKKIVITTADTAGDAVDAVPAFRKMISVDKPAVIIGPFSNSDLAVLPIVKSNTIPVFEQGGMVQLNNVKVPYFWRTNASDNQEGAADAYYAIHEHWTRGAFAYTTAAGAATLKNPTRQAYEAHGGKIVVDTPLVPDATSYRSEILRIMASHPQVVFFQQDPQTAGTFFSEVNQLGFMNKTHWIGTDVEYSSDFFKALGSKLATTNIVFTNNALETGTAANVFLHWYEKTAHTNIPAVAAPQGYDAMITAALAMVAAHSAAGPAVNAEILKVANPPGTKVYSFAQGVKLLKEGKKINYEGVGSTVDFNAFHSVVGPFGVYKFNAKGQIEELTVINSPALQAFAK